MKIDAFAHWYPKKAAQAIMAKVKPGSDPRSLEYVKRMERRSVSNDLDLRFRLMERHPDIYQVITFSLPFAEWFCTPKDTAEVCKIINDEMAEMVTNYPNRLVGAVASLPLNDIDLALKECDRALTELRMVGILLYTNIVGERLDSPRLRPLYEKMVKYNRPIWVHPTDPPPLHIGQESGLGWEYEISRTMVALAQSDWVFKEFPNLKWIHHHLGAMIPTYRERIAGPWHVTNPDTLPNLHKFYVDTSIYGNTAGLMNGYDFFGADHVLFGTDMTRGPNPDITEWTVRAVDRMDIPQVDKDKIYLENAVRVIGLAL